MLSFLVQRKHGLFYSLRSQEGENAARKKKFI